MSHLRKLKKECIDLFFGLSSSDILSRTEVELFSFEFFVAEFGGALGLLLGFSYMMFWDGLKLVGQIHSGRLQRQFDNNNALLSRN